MKELKIKVIITPSEIWEIIEESHKSIENYKPDNPFDYYGNKYQTKLFCIISKKSKLKKQNYDKQRIWYDVDIKRVNGEIKEIDRTKNPEYFI